jgi:hypothetical protein
MLGVLLLLGHIKSIAAAQGFMSESVGCLLGHLIVDHALPCGCRKRMSVLTLLPDAVNMSDRNSTWRETQTLFRHQSASSV